MKDFLYLAAQSIRRRKLRSWLTILGIIIGIATIVSLISLGEGMQNAIEEQFEKMGVSSIRVVPEGLRGPPAGDKGLNESDAEFVEKIVGVEYVDRLLLNFADVEFGNDEQFLMTLAYDTELGEEGLVDSDLAPIEGRLFQKGDRGVVLVGYDTAYDENIFRKDIRVKNKIKINGETFEVVGIIEKAGLDFDKQIYLPLEDARELFDKPDLVNVLRVQVLPGIDKDKLVEKITKKLTRKRDAEDFEAFTPEQIQRQFNSILDVVKVVLGGIAFISLVVGAVGIMNTMFTSVLERTREIGVMKAVGAQRWMILLLYMLESGMLGLIGGTIGAVIGMLIAYAVEFGAIAAGFELLSIRLNLMLILFALGFSLLIGIISGILPAIRASRLSPVDALRYE